MSSYCMGISVRGVLKLSEREFRQRHRGICKNAAGRVLSVEEVKDYFLDALSKGHEVVPMGKCELWDFKKGCPGHPEVAEELRGEIEELQEKQKGMGA